MTDTKSTTPPRIRVQSILNLTGILAIAVSIVVLAVGLLLVGRVSEDFDASILVTTEAVNTISDTIDVVNDATSTLSEGIDAASTAVGGVSSTASISADGITNLADFLETDLPEDLVAIRSTMPAAIQAASAIDRTLRTLSFVGVPYDPDQPFDESLRSVEAALVSLPEDLKVQSATLRELAPAATALGVESERLATALTDVGDDISRIKTITGEYQSTVDNALFVLEDTQSSIEGDAWLIRLLIIAVSAMGIAIGSGLVAAGRAFGDIAYSSELPKVLTEVHVDPEDETAVEVTSTEVRASGESVS